MTWTAIDEALLRSGVPLSQIQTGVFDTPGAYLAGHADAGGQQIVNKQFIKAVIASPKTSQGINTPPVGTATNTPYNPGSASHPLQTIETFLGIGVGGKGGKVPSWIWLIIIAVAFVLLRSK